MSKDDSRRNSFASLFSDDSHSGKKGRVKKGELGPKIKTRKTNVRANAEQKHEKVYDSLKVVDREPSVSVFFPAMLA
jgi:hypothetical protein